MQNKQPDTEPFLLKIFQHNWHLLKFVVIYFLLLGVLYLLLGSFRDLPIYLDYLGAITNGVSWLLNIIGVDHSLQRAYAPEHNDMIVTDIVNVRLVIGQNYDGLYPILLLLPAILAWPGAALTKAVYVGLSAIAMLVLNVARIATSISFDQHFPLNFELVHFYIAPLVLVFIPVLLLFLGWVLSSSSSKF